MTNTQRIDAAIARYKAAAAAAADLGIAQKHLVQLARRHGVRRAGVLLLVGRSNWASLVRDPALWVARHFRRGHWRVLKAWTANGSRVTSHQSRRRRRV